MNTWTTSLVASCLFAGIAQVPVDPRQATDPPAEPARGRLVRSAPSRAPVARAATQADVDGWRDRISSADLEERERAFDALIAAAKREPSLAAAIEEWAADASTPELAWTARLALREIRDARTLRFEAWPDGLRAWPSNPDGYGLGFEGHDPLALWRDRLGGVDPFEGFGSMLQRQRGGGSSSVESVTLEVDDDGVTCKVTKEVDGEQVTEEYTAASMEDLLLAHPELRDRLAPGVDPSLRFFAAPDAPWLALPRRGNALRTDVLGVVVVPLAPDEASALALEGGRGVRIERVEPGTIAEQLGL